MWTCLNSEQKQFFTTTSQIIQNRSWIWIALFALLFSIMSSECTEMVRITKLLKHLSLMINIVIVNNFNHFFCMKLNLQLNFYNPDQRAIIHPFESYSCLILLRVKIWFLNNRFIRIRMLYCSIMSIKYTAN